MSLPSLGTGLAVPLGGVAPGLGVRAGMLSLGDRAGALSLGDGGSVALGRRFFGFLCRRLLLAASSSSASSALIASSAAFSASACFSALTSAACFAAAACISWKRPRTRWARSRYASGKVEDAHDACRTGTSSADALRRWASSACACRSSRISI
eukprot:4240827-Prymnesium_polylepis.1